MSNNGERSPGTFDQQSIDCYHYMYIHDSIDLKRMGQVIIEIDYFAQLLYICYYIYIYPPPPPHTRINVLVLRKCWLDPENSWDFISGDSGCLLPSTCPSRPVLHLASIGKKLNSPPSLLKCKNVTLYVECQLRPAEFCRVYSRIITVDVWLFVIPTWLLSPLSITQIHVHIKYPTCYMYKYVL